MAYSIPGAFILIGGIILLHASMIPQYTDSAWDSPEKEARWNNPANSGKDTERMAREWHDARQKVLTSHDRECDIGLAFILLGVSIAAIFGIKRVREFGSIRRIDSPRTRLRFFLLAAATWLSFAIAMATDDEMRFSRGEFPGWAEPSPTEDGLVLIAALVTLPVVLMGVQLAVWQTPLPVELASGRPMRNVPMELLILGAIISDIYVLYIGFTEEVWVTPAAVVTMYLLLSGRAAANHPSWSGKTSANATTNEIRSRRT
jgi:hypothetical protein